MVGGELLGPQQLVQVALHQALVGDWRSWYNLKLKNEIIRNSFMIYIYINIWYMIYDTYMVYIHLYDIMIMCIIYDRWYIYDVHTYISHLDNVDVLQTWHFLLAQEVPINIFEGYCDHVKISMISMILSWGAGARRTSQNIKGRFKLSFGEAGWSC